MRVYVGVVHVYLPDHQQHVILQNTPINAGLETVLSCQVSEHFKTVAY